MLGETCVQVVDLRVRFRPFYRAYHTQLGHQGPERTVFLLRRHFHWARDLDIVKLVHPETIYAQCCFPVERFRGGNHQAVPGPSVVNSPAGLSKWGNERQLCNER